jgi:hypothetical protein
MLTQEKQAPFPPQLEKIIFLTGEKYFPNWAAKTGFLEEARYVLYPTLLAATRSKRPKVSESTIGGIVGTRPSVFLSACLLFCRLL